VPGACLDALQSFGAAFRSEPLGHTVEAGWWPAWFYLSV